MKNPEDVVKEVRDWKSRWQKRGADIPDTANEMLEALEAVIAERNRLRNRVDELEEGKV